MRVHWTDHALRQLDAIYDYIAQDSKTYATRVVDRLTRRSQQIGQFPNSGRIVQELGHPEVREVIESPYRILYWVGEEQVDVLMVVHSSQRPPFGIVPRER